MKLCGITKKKIKNLIYLHGRSSIHNSLIFPTEYITDHIPYDTDIINNKISDIEINTLSDIFFRTYYKMFGIDLLSAKAQLHDFMIKKINNVKNVIIWGFSANIYDVEFLTLLEYINDIPNKIITVIDTDYKIIEKFKYLFKTDKINYCNPQKDK